MVNGQKEIWKRLERNQLRSKSIIAVSNCGRIMRYDGTIEFSYYRQPIKLSGKNVNIHRIIAKLFISKTEDDIIKGRDYVDHITHYPKNMNINDVRNMRWCTKKENSNFEEAITNFRAKKYKQPKSEFGRMFIEKYGISATDNVSFYNRLRRHYIKYGVLL